MIKQFFITYPKLKEYINKTIKQAETLGYVENLHGLRLNTPACKLGKGADYNRQVKQAVNFTIQSTNSTLLYKCLLEFMKEVNTLNLDIKLIWTIYDACYFEYNHTILDKQYVIDLIKKHFEQVINGLEITIDIQEYKENGSWYDTI